jgi:hypothetical protein
LNLTRQLTELIEKTDVKADPMRVSEAARLLSEAQQLEERTDRLRKRIDALMSSNGKDPALGSKSLADWAYEVLSDHREPMRYREIAAVIKERGFKHSRQPKHPEKQLADSVWTAMYEDSRFTKVGRGIFDLTERL